MALRSVPAEHFEAEELDPVRLLLARQEFRGALADALVPVAPHEPMVVQEEPQQVQIGLADVPAQEEVVPQAAIEVLWPRWLCPAVGKRICG